MTASKVSDLDRLLDEIQTSLVELFEQFRELRTIMGRALESTASDMESGPSARGVTLSESRGGSDTGDSGLGIKPERSDETSSTVQSRRSNVGTKRTDEAGEVKEWPEGISATAARVLDPIVRELRTGSASAEVLAEFVQEAKDYLIDPHSPNEKVSRDMDIVLKFLRSRGGKPITSDQRDNILKRIQRWKLHLSGGPPSP
ncbi:MAG: hypothetical protein HXY34_00830 [Candidatus Thorarchaeota archaeon]|nr:hypothetical protein [Candidatus Thorarchaeota archaeon]